MEAGTAILVDEALIAQVGISKASEVEILVVGVTTSESPLWYRFFVPKTSRVVRKFFQSWKKDPGLVNPGVYTNLFQGKNGEHDFYFRSTVVVSGLFESHDDTVDDTPEESTHFLRDAELRFVR